jgi:hypothetical protein
VSGHVDKYRVSTSHPDTGRANAGASGGSSHPTRTPATAAGHRGGFATRKAAEAALAEVLGQVNAGTYVAPSRSGSGST